MIKIPASDLIVGQLFQFRYSDVAPRTFVVMVNDKLYAVPLDGASSGYGEPLWDYLDPSENVYLSD
ncbi:MAG: hypothetical protein BWK73_20005 [Thiothrix lacustris]|uniref:Uncharacterized protein n=1 Tax=Thiothrix lacustris TaxID=525917 RepID=A0A1Y1QPP0_9GAMM|nr:MAG: hypothetical protein BWK73_20005 [Thiothrix lacustris]